MSSRKRSRGSGSPLDEPGYQVPGRLLLRPVGYQGFRPLGKGPIRNCFFITLTPSVTPWTGCRFLLPDSCPRTKQAIQWSVGAFLRAQPNFHPARVSPPTVDMRERAIIPDALLLQNHSQSLLSPDLQPVYLVVSSHLTRKVTCCRLSSQKGNSFRSVAPHEFWGLTLYAFSTRSHGPPLSFGLFERRPCRKLKKAFMIRAVDHSGLSS